MSLEPPTPPTVVRNPLSVFAVVLANIAKAAGVIFGSIEAVGPARPTAVLFWVALFLGAQALEDLLTRLIDRTMGK